MTGVGLARDDWAVRAAAIVLLIAAGPGELVADELRGGGSLALDLRGHQGDSDEPVRVLTVGPRARAVGGPARRVGLALGLDLRGGVASGGHFAYEANVMPLGLGLLLGQSARVGLVTGGGVSGVTGGTLPIAFALPVEAFAEASLGSRVRVAAWGRATALLGSDQRQSGAEDAPFGDEVEAGLTLRWDRRRSDHGFATGNGYHLGATWAEQAGVTMFGFVLGYSLDAGRAAVESRFVDEGD